jgi:hypothetical protein
LRPPAVCVFSSSSPSIIASIILQSHINSSSLCKNKTKTETQPPGKAEHIKLSPGVRTWGDLLLDGSSSNNKVSEKSNYVQNHETQLHFPETQEM